MIKASFDEQLALWTATCDYLRSRPDVLYDIKTADIRGIQETTLKKINEVLTCHSAEFTKNVAESTASFNEDHERGTYKQVGEGQQELDKLVEPIYLFTLNCIELDAHLVMDLDASTLLVRLIEWSQQKPNEITFDKPQLRHLVYAPKVELEQMYPDYPRCNEYVRCVGEFMSKSFVTALDSVNARFDRLVKLVEASFTFTTLATTFKRELTDWTDKENPALIMPCGDLIDAYYDLRNWPLETVAHV